MTERKEVPGRDRDMGESLGEDTGGFVEATSIIQPPLYELRLRVSPHESCRNAAIDVGRFGKTASLSVDAAFTMVERLRQDGEAKLSSRTREVAETWAAELNDSFKSEGLPVFCTMRRT